MSLLNVFLICDPNGEIVLSHSFSLSASVQAAAGKFKRSVVGPGFLDRDPINVCDGTVFCHVRRGSLYLCACSENDVDAVAVFTLLHQIAGLISDCCSGLTESTVRKNSSRILEMLDEVVDTGFVLDTSNSTLQGRLLGFDLASAPHEAEKLNLKDAALETLGLYSGRREQVIVPTPGEVYIELMERINVLISNDGSITQNEVTGTVQFVGQLRGSPRCSLTLDTSCIQQNIGVSGARSEGLSFHSCVNFQEYESHGRINFNPPSGRFDLIIYRLATPRHPPIVVVNADVSAESRTRIQIKFALRLDFPTTISPRILIVRVPVPENTAKADIRVSQGRARHEAPEGAIVWTMKHCDSSRPNPEFSAELKLAAKTLQKDEKEWTPPTIAIEFNAPYAASGIQVKNLIIPSQSTSDKVSKWIRFETTAGEYHCRL